MRLRPDLGRGATLLVLSRVAIFLGTAASSLVVARVLGPREFGVVASATAITGLLVVAGSFGLDQLYLMGSLDGQTIQVRFTQATMITAAITTAGALAWPSVTTATRVCVLLIGLATAIDYLKLPWLLEPQKDLNFGLRARREVMLRLGVAGAAVAGVAVSQSPVTVGAAMLAASALLVWPARGWPRLDRHLPLASLPELMRRGLPFAMSGAFYTLYFQVDMALLASLGSTEGVAQYRAAYNFMAAAVILAVALNNEVMRPRLYRAMESPKEFAALLRSSLVLTLAAGVGCTAVLVVLGPTLVRAFYGDAYEPARSLVRLIGWAVVPHFFNSWAGNALVARRHVRPVVTLQAFLVAVNVAGNLVLIPSHGARGAALMTVATETTGAGLYAYALWRLAGSVGAGGDLGYQALPEQEP